MINLFDIFIQQKTMEIYNSNNNNMVIYDSNQTYYIASEDDYSTLIASINGISYKLDVLKYITMVAIIVTAIMAFLDLYIHIKNSKNVLVAQKNTCEI